MVSKSVAFLLADLGVTKTHSRPHVSNDNPFSEAQFKTLKYRPAFPRDAGLATLGMQVGAVRKGAMAGGRRWRAVHAGVQRLVGEGLDLRPREPGRAGAQHRGADGAAADPQALRHLPVGAPEAPLLSQDLPCLAHGQSLGRHPSPFRGRTVRPTVPRRYASAIALMPMRRSRRSRRR